MKAFLIDLDKCIGCYNCQIGCKDEHCGNDWMPYAKSQPDVGQFWMHLNEQERGARPHVKVTYTPILCQHCEDAPCMSSCSNEAFYRRADGLIILDPESCTGCGDCIGACPYHAIFMNTELNIAQKCTGCAHLLDGGHPISVPRCADNCPTDVIQFGDVSDLDLEGAEILHPEYGTRPRVYYRNLPKRFVAGTLYDPDKLEVIENASVELRNGDSVFSTATDNYGDFWLKNLPEADFTLTISFGAKTKILDISTKEKDIGLGDLPLN
jgi:Fe-S-cluster-containing dehydrogenase component